MRDDDLITRIVLAANWSGGVIYFHILNETRIYNHQGLLKETGILYVASHFTMVDSWLLGSCFNLFDALFRPEIIPYNVPEWKNFVKLFPWWFKHSKCIPVRRPLGWKDAHLKIKEIISQRISNVLIFPESSRRIKGEPIRISVSVGKLIAEAGAQKIIPIRLVGLPYKGSFLPVIFRRIKMIIGNPLVISLAVTPGKEREDYLRIAEQIRDSIEALEIPKK